ncbi:hypothetical protein P691DRAFT_574038 [Macrolepiota fuliginosa MF-IS2]|uniref:Uncharacterized protein n=1 Tax=Macrolepiota fuliginosa MF-IS2 TaxID=1400762 RepID=A0A9P5XE01_9AGAR|nr:hypothetical protein P691DRAFT_574038 [Macrolepiota fuliginosa MF-IS2]
MKNWAAFPHLRKGKSVLFPPLNESMSISGSYPRVGNVPLAIPETRNVIAQTLRMRFLKLEDIHDSNITPPATGTRLPVLSGEPQASQPPCTLLRIATNH